MTENELFQMFIQERINMLLLNLDKEQPTETIENKKEIFKAEEIINSLPNADKNLVQKYIDNIMERMAREEPFLYKHGFLDGIKAFKNIVNL